MSANPQADQVKGEVPSDVSASVLGNVLADLRFQNCPVPKQIKKLCQDMMMEGANLPIGAKRDSVTTSGTGTNGVTEPVATTSGTACASLTALPKPSAALAAIMADSFLTEHAKNTVTRHVLAAEARGDDIPAAGVKQLLDTVAQLRITEQTALVRGKPVSVQAKRIAITCQAISLAARQRAPLSLVTALVNERAGEKLPSLLAGVAKFLAADLPPEDVFPAYKSAPRSLDSAATEVAHVAAWFDSHGANGQRSLDFGNVCRLVGYCGRFTNAETKLNKIAEAENPAAMLYAMLQQHRGGAASVWEGERGFRDEAEMGSPGDEDLRY